MGNITMGDEECHLRELSRWSSPDIVIFHCGLASQDGNGIVS